jgi:hypothetical protein
LTSFCETLTDLRRLVAFVNVVFDRRHDDSVNNLRDAGGDAPAAATPLPPFTFEAFADGLSDLVPILRISLSGLKNFGQFLNYFGRGVIPKFGTNISQTTWMQKYISKCLCV